MTEKQLPPYYERVLRLIPQGMTRPITNREIQTLTGFPERTIRDVIKNLITDYKIPIGAVRGLVNGYYIPTNDSERLAGIRQLDKQVQEEQRRINALMYADLKEHEKYLKEGGNA